VALVLVTIFLGLRFLGDYSPLRENKHSYSQFKDLISTPDVRIVKMQIDLKGINRAVLHVSG